MFLLALTVSWAHSHSFSSKSNGGQRGGAGDLLISRYEVSVFMVLESSHTHTKRDREGGERKGGWEAGMEERLGRMGG